MPRSILLNNLKDLHAAHGYDAAEDRSLSKMRAQKKLTRELQDDKDEQAVGSMAETLKKDSQQPNVT